MLTFSGGEGLHERMSALNFLPIIEAEVIRSIRVDVQQGLSPDGSALSPYEANYAKWRMARGLSSTVNLRVKQEDSMLDTLGATTIDRNHSVISVASDREGQAEGLSKKRQFMGVSANAVVRIEQKLEDEFVRMIK
jgi:hypothetical protein